MQCRRKRKKKKKPKGKTLILSIYSIFPWVIRTSDNHASQEIRIRFRTARDAQTPSEIQTRLYGMQTTTG